jgi:ABC-type dipeptide/oligopeptide/nickel transport system ATPase component
VKHFTLQSLLVVNNNKNIFDIKFLDADVSRTNLLSSVIIGANGAGKSYLLTIICDIFRALENKIKEKEINLRYDRYLINYYMEGDFYSVEISGKRNLNIKKNDQNIKIDQLKLPKKVLAVSYMVNDKFTYKTPYSMENDMYEYLGIRRTSNAAWTNSITRRISDAFIEISSNNNFIYKIKEILTFLELDSKITLIFEPVGKTLFQRTTTEKQLKTKLNKLLNTDEYRSYTIKRNLDQVPNLLNFINKISRKRNLQIVNDKSHLVYNISFDAQKTENYLIEDKNYLRALVDLQLIYSPKLILYKDNDEFDFELASSGEKHFIFYS